MGAGAPTRLAAFGSLPPPRWYGHALLRLEDDQSAIEHRDVRIVPEDDVI